MQDFGPRGPDCRSRAVLPKEMRFAGLVGTRTEQRSGAERAPGSEDPGGELG